jgi:hypothetical protein
MKTLPPITPELEEQSAAITAMLEHTRAVLGDYIQQHPGKLHHISEEAALLCRNLLLHLRHLPESGLAHGDSEVNYILSSIYGDADSLDKMAYRLHEEGGDDRLMQALCLLAESFRLTAPAVLRWCFDYHGRLPTSTLDARCQRFERVLKPLAHDLTAA